MSTSLPPWETDRHLDDEVAARVLARAAPDLSRDGLHWVGRGWDYDVYRLGDRGLRFPRRRECSTTHRWEGRLLDRVGPRLAELGIQVPRVERVLPPGEDFPYPVTLFRWVEGRPLAPEWRETTARALGRLGRALRVLHGTPAGARIREGVPHSVWSVADRVREAQGGLTALKSAAGDDPVLRPAMRWLESLDPERLPELGSSPARLLHGDVVAEHVLVDADGHLTGIIDWSDAMVEDPANDFVSIAAEWGEPGLKAALEGYGDASTDLRGRIVFMARATCLHWVHDRIVGGGDARAELRRVEAVFALPLG